MAPHASIPRMPGELLDELDLLLGERNFNTFSELSDWLLAHGYAIAISAIAISAAPLKPSADPFERRLDEIRQITAQARAVAGASPDEEGGINEALMRLVQQRLFEILMALEVSDLKKINLSSLARSVAEMGRASVVQKRWLAEVREKLAEKVKAASATVIEAANNAGLSPETEQRIRNALLEITV
ncbi:MAG: phage protein Gp27 family protein [Candidatus Binataceae bacterium]